MKKITYLSLAIFSVILIVSVLLKNNLYSQDSLSGPHAIVGGQLIRLELAKTSQEQRQGLSGRSSLCSDCGMLFIFPTKRMQRFWMKNMNFSLDLIWLDGEKIVGLSRDLPPAGEAPAETYGADQPVDMVLEMKAGAIGRLNLNLGDKIILKI